MKKVLFFGGLVALAAGVGVFFVGGWSTVALSLLVPLFIIPIFLAAADLIGLYVIKKAIKSAAGEENFVSQIREKMEKLSQEFTEAEATVTA